MVRDVVGNCADWEELQGSRGIETGFLHQRLGAREDGMLCVGIARYGYGAWVPFVTTSSWVCRTSSFSRSTALTRRRSAQSWSGGETRRQVAGRRPPSPSCELPAQRAEGQDEQWHQYGGEEGTGEPSPQQPQAHGPVPRPFPRRLLRAQHLAIRGSCIRTMAWIGIRMARRMGIGKAAMRMTTSGINTPRSGGRSIIGRAARISTVTFLHLETTSRRASAAFLTPSARSLSRSPVRRRNGSRMMTRSLKMIKQGLVAIGKSHQLSGPGSRARGA